MNNGSNGRAVVFATVMLFAFVVVVIRLTDLMLLEHEALTTEARKQHTRSREVSINRGYVYDRRGHELAINLDTMSVYTNPKDVVERKETARVLSEYTGRAYQTLYKEIADERRGFIWVERKLDAVRAEQLRQKGLPGVGFIPEAQRFYPRGSLAAHVIGFVGVDNQALEGIELTYDESIKGAEHRVVMTRDAAGRPLSSGIEYQPRGNSVVLTIDEGLQYIVEKELENAIKEWDATAAMSIMMNPYNGEILAMANWPTYDLNDPSSAKGGQRRNRSITDPYEPGSTFKLITAAAALEEGVVTPTETFDVSGGYIDIGPMRVYDTHEAEQLSFADIIKTSSNVGTIQVGKRLEGSVFYKYIKAFGFGDRTGIDLPGENAGFIRHIDAWSGTSHAAMSIGYEVSVTPIQLLRAYSVVANGGWLVPPHVVSEVRSPEGQKIYSYRPDEYGRVLSVKTANTLKHILISVTGEGGTAREAAIDGNQVAGKTGTTRLTDPVTGKYSRERYISSFVGFVPAENPKISLVVVVFEPKRKYYGGTVAAPVFRAVARQALGYLNVPREDVLEKNILLVKKSERSAQHAVD